ncbi:hypothetical protein B0H19DRAFT_1131391 [Mycena capillaripes]|nr:hypothetical protein B0H19DRAFT_1131391 [Mycena capillaripes]
MSTSLRTDLATHGACLVLFLFLVDGKAHSAFSSQPRRQAPWLTCIHTTTFLDRLMRYPLLSLFSSLFSVVQAYNIVDNFQGLTFFDNWDFYGNYDNLTLGDVVWLNEADAFTQELALVNAAGNVIIKVDNFSNVPFNQKRNSVRITTKSTYSLGSLWIIDAVHLPYGCSVWPSIWTMGPSWPTITPNGSEFAQWV